MADREDTPNTRKKSRKPSLRPDPQVIDLTAEDVTASENAQAPASAPEENATPATETPLGPSLDTAPDPFEETPYGEPASPETPRAPITDSELEDLAERDAEARAADLPEAEEVSMGEMRPGIGTLIACGVIGALITIVAFLITVTADILPLRSGSDAAIGNRLSALEARVETGPPSAEATAELSDRVSRLEDGEKRLSSRIDTLNKAVDALKPEIAAAGTGTGGADVAALRQSLDERLATLEGENKKLATDVSQAQAAAQAATQASQNGVSSAALEGLTGRVASLEGAVQREQSPDPAVQRAGNAADAAAALAAVSALDVAVDRGGPFSTELSTVHRLLPDTDTSVLSAAAEKGLPNTQELAIRLATDLAGADTPPVANDGGLMDRLLSGARSLVHVRPVGHTGETEGNSPDAVRNRVVARLDNGDYAGALQAWDSLDDTAKAATKSAADALRQRLAINDALAALRRQALSDLPVGAAEAQP